ncbi:winged helix-turn-helix domain-containing protein [Novosphingobium panipatense]
MREEDRRFILVITPSTAHEGAELLRVGFGEAVAEAIEGGEFAARAGRLAELTGWVLRHRRLGDLELDLVAREAYGHGKSLNLNPREFALIWRLADAPGETVSKQDLIHDVWRMGFVPETNSIAVHMSRLRRKLGFVGLSGIIATSPNGGYCLMRADDVPPAPDIAFTSVQPPASLLHRPCFDAQRSSLGNRAARSAGVLMLATGEAVSTCLAPIVVANRFSE